MVRTVFFDLDETILDFSRAEAAALERALREAGAPYSEEIRRRYHTINGEQWELLEDGILTREEVLERRFQLLFGELGVSAGAAGVSERYESYLEAGRWLIPGALALLEALSPKYALYAASNGSAAVQRRRLEASGILPFFRDVFISEEMGAEKPSPVFFEKAFRRIPDFRRQEAVIIGDSLTSDIRGGWNAGIRTCWYNPEGKPLRREITPHYEVSALEDIPALLETL